MAQMSIRDEEGETHFFVEEGVHFLEPFVVGINERCAVEGTRKETIKTLGTNYE